LKLKAYLKPLWTGGGPVADVLTGPRCRCLFVFVFYFCKIILTYFILCIVSVPPTHSKNWSIWTTYLGKKKKERPELLVPLSWL
jgi:hypothetical protein